MKLFQQLLVAPAALGLLAPLSASASEINLDAISNYSENNLEIDSNSKSSNSLSDNNANWVWVSFEPSMSIFCDI